MTIFSKNSFNAYKELCTEYYEIDKPLPPKDEYNFYFKYIEEAKGSILEPMCGSGRFMIPLLKKGFSIDGFDTSPYMIKLCKEKCKKENLSCQILEASFETFKNTKLYNLVFIPSGSFCLLINKNDIENALKVIYNYLNKNGKFVFDFDTIHSLGDLGIWKGSWVEKEDQSKIIIRSISKFNSKTNIQTSLNIYEKWEKGQIIKTETEEFNLKLYEIDELEKILKNNGFKINKKLISHTNKIPDKKSKFVTFECIKS